MNDADQTAPRPLPELRDAIDGLDREIVALLDARAGLAREVGRAKQAAAMPHVFDASRQKRVLDNAAAASDGSFPAESLRRVYVEIMSGSLLVERPPTVGFLGPEGTFSHEASLGEFGGSVVHKPFDDFAGIFRAVDLGWIDYGVLPIENSTHGVLHSVLDLFLEHDVRIVSEVYQVIHHQLIGRVDIDRVKTVYSKAEPFLQCAGWLKQHLPGVQLIEVGSTAKGVELAKDRDYAAAIGPELAARRFGVPVVAANIEDMKDNATRFVVIGKQRSRPTGRDRTSLMVSIDDRPGALFELLQPLHSRGINLTKIESRPTRRKAWDLVFFMDMLGHEDEEPLAAALAELRGNAKELRVMGSYPLDAGVPVPKG